MVIQKPQEEDTLLELRIIKHYLDENRIDLAAQRLQVMIIARESKTL